MIIIKLVIFVYQAMQANIIMHIGLVISNLVHLEWEQPA